MTITIRLFAIVRERAGVSEFTINLPVGATVVTACDAILQKYPALSDLIPRVAFAVNREYAPLNHALHDCDEIAVIPPVSGG